MYLTIYTSQSEPVSAQPCHIFPLLIQIVGLVLYRASIVIATRMFWKNFMYFIWLYTFLNFAHNSTGRVTA